jgi:AcrR family transcriptional regulator
VVSAQRRARERENLRRAILDAARELFVTEGYEAVSMRRIAEKIEYSPTAIYLYFKDKEEIRRTLVEEGFTLLRERLDTLDHPDPVERMRQGAHVYLDFALTQPNYYKLMFEVGDVAHVVACLTEDDIGMRAFSFIPLCLAEAIAQGKFAPIPDLWLVSHAVWAHLHGAASLALAGRLAKLPEGQHRAFFDAVIDLTLRGLKPG